MFYFIFNGNIILTHFKPTGDHKNISETANVLFHF